MATEPEEGKRPGLHWPEHDLVPASRREDPEPEPEERPTDRPAPEPVLPEEPLTASVLFTVASRLESLKTSLATMGARIEALARSEEQFREFTTARLGEHTEQIAGSMREISKTLETRGREQEKAFAARDEAQDKAFAGLQSGVNESSGAAAAATEALDQMRQRMEEFSKSLEVLAGGLSQSLEGLTGQVQAVAEDVPSLRAELIDFIARTDSRSEELAGELSRLVDEVKVLRRRMPVRAAAASPAKRPTRRAEPEPVEDEDDFIVEEPAPAPTSRRRSRARRSD